MSDQIVQMTTPLSDRMVDGLRAGDVVRLSGRLYVARDAAHKRMVKALERGAPLPFQLPGQVIYYMGPSPARPGKPIGSAGPTTSYRMDSYAPKLLARGIKGMIGKGARSQEVREAMQHHGAVYFVAVGGAAALIAQSIRAAKVIAYPELGAEAVRELQVERLPLIVGNDRYGGDIYERGQAAYGE